MAFQGYIFILNLLLIRYLVSESCC
ncbi:unnamed protein product, partial [Vitis vinifera]